MKRKKLTGCLLCVVLMFITASALAAPVPDTGQKECYDVAGNVITCPSPGQALYGQDANYQTNPMSYTKLDANGKGLPDSTTSWEMLRDNNTGLVWEMKTNKDDLKNYLDPHDADNTYTWYDSNPDTNGGDPGTPRGGADTEGFLKKLNDAKYGGYSDWRLPTIKELTCIIDYSIPKPGPTIDTGYFPNTIASFYWASSTNAATPPNAWGVFFLYGFNYNVKKSYDFYALAVRGGQSGFQAAAGGDPSMDSLNAGYTDNQDGTVTDNSTGLMWEQNGTTGLSWEQSLSYCVNLNLGGHKDWRLPTIKELHSLGDFQHANPAIDTDYFPNTQSFYWSSTTYAYFTGYAWGINFDSGDDPYYYKAYGGNVRAVRGGQAEPMGYLVVSPLSRTVTIDAGTTTFDVFNTGMGKMLWTAAVISGDGWLSITSGGSGIDSGRISCGYDANKTSFSRTGVIRVTAPGAAGSPVDITVNQAPMPTACRSTMDSNIAIHMPILDYNPSGVAISFWADFDWMFIPMYPTYMFFKLKDFGLVQKDAPTCEPSTLSESFLIHIPDLLLPDGFTQLWVDMQYVPFLSTDGSAVFVVMNYGVAIS
jgi:hypothetical protein